MAKQVLLYKRQRDAKQRCTTFRVDQPSYKFTLETCEDLIATISDNRGNRIASVDVDHHAIVSKVGTYNVCIVGDGVGTLYVEWTSDSAVDERCCQDVQEYLTTYVDEKIVATRVSVSAGENVTVVANGNDYKVSAKNTTTALVAGTNISIVDSGTNGNHIYTVSSTGGGGGSTECCDELNNRIDNITITGGIGISVTKNGDNYTITNTGGGGLPSDFDIVQGTNVQVNKSGNRYTISATDTVTTVKQGTNTTVTKNGNEYTVNATDTKPVLTSSLVSTCDIGSITQGEGFAAGTPLETIIRKILTCNHPQPPTPTTDYPWFTSEITDTSTWTERWNEFSVSASAGEHTFNVARTYEEHPVKFDIPASLHPVTLELYNRITSQWEVNTRDFSTENITRIIDGETVQYVRYTDARETDAVGRPVKIIWNP